MSTLPAPSASVRSSPWGNAGLAVGVGWAATTDGMAASNTMRQAATVAPLASQNRRRGISGITHLGHQPTHHVDQVVAVEQPRARVIGDEFDVVLLHVAESDGVLERTINRAAVDGDKLERVTVQVHRMILHAHVEQSQPDALSDFDVDGRCVWIAAAVDGPGI